MKKIIISIALILSLSAFNAQAAGNNTVLVTVNGLVCDFCAQALKKVFGKEESVESINVDLDSSLVTISMKKDQTMPEERIRELITDSGYNVEDINYGTE